MTQRATNSTLLQYICLKKKKERGKIYFYLRHFIISKVEVGLAGTCNCICRTTDIL